MAMVYLVLGPYPMLTSIPNHLSVILLDEPKMGGIAYSFRRLLPTGQPEECTGNTFAPSLFAHHVWQSTSLINTIWHFFWPSETFHRLYVAQELNFNMPLVGGLVLVENQMYQGLKSITSPTDMQKHNTSINLSGIMWMKASQIPYVVVIVQRKLNWSYPYYPAITPPEFREIHSLDINVPILTHEGELDAHNLLPLLETIEKYLLPQQNK